MIDPAPYLRRLRSLKLTLPLLLILSVVASAGTALPPEKLEAFYQGKIGEALLPAARFAGLVDTYHSPLFLMLLGLLLCQISYCTLYRNAGKFRGTGRAFTARLRLRRWTDLILHLSVVAIICGAAAGGIWGFLGTQYLFLDKPEGVVSKWPDRGEIPLGFSLVYRGYEKFYYPFRLKVRVSTADSGEELSIVELVEGRTASLENDQLELNIASVDVDSGTIVIDVGSGAVSERIEFSLAGGKEGEAVFAGFHLKLKAFSHVLKDVRSRVEVVEEGRTVKEGFLTARTNVKHRGFKVFQSDMGVDAYGFEFVGVQVSRDPGAPLFWAGAIALSLMLPLFLFLKHSRA